MKKRMISIIIVLVILFTYLLDTSAYTVGSITYDLSIEYCVDTQNVNIESDDLHFYAGGSAKYDFYLPFNSVSVDVFYQASLNASLQVKTGTKNYSFLLDSTKTSTTCSFQYTERTGERAFEFVSDSDIVISKIVFNKEDILAPQIELMLPNLTANEVAIETAVLIDIESSIIIVNGGKRYIDFEDPKEVPQIIDGIIYLPVATFARAFGCYYEDLPGKCYVLLRNGNLEFCFSRNISYKQLNSNQPELIPNLVIYKNGSALIPVRYFAEELGETVGYKDGLIAIDDKFSVDNILNNSIVYDYAKSIFVPFIPQQITGNTYYISQSPEASDNNDGSFERPFKTLNKAGQIAVAGDTVIIRAGIYREIFTPQNDGNPTNPIIFKAAENENVVISANEEVSNFADYTTGIVSTGLNWSLGNGRNQVFYNGESLIEARYPNTPNIATAQGEPELSKLFPTKGDIQVSKENMNEAISDTLLNQEVDYWKDGYFVSLHGYGYALGTAHITGSTSGKLYLDNTSTKWWFNPNNTNLLNYGYITGNMNALDIPGEWIIKNSSLYLGLPDGETAQTLKVEVKKRQLVVDLANRKYVQLEGINTIGGGIKMNDSEMCMLNGGNIRYISHYTQSMDQREGYIDDCNVSDPNGAPPRGEVGIYVGGSDNIIINTHIDFSAGAGIYGVGKYTYIENNIISNCGYMGSYVAGITFDGKGWESVDAPRGGYGVYGNTVYNAGRAVININSPANWVNGGKITPYIPFEVAFNDFHNGMLSSLDTGITYSYGTLEGFDKLNTSYHNNMIYYSMPEKNPFVCSAIYHDGYTQGVNTYENLIFNVQPNTELIRYIYYQQYENAIANGEAWSNSCLANIMGGRNGLKPQDFPYCKPFDVGSKLNKEDYLVNYENIGSNFGCYCAKDATLSTGVILNNGVAQFSGNDQWIKFANVDFGEVSNAINIYFKGDKYNTNDIAEIIIGTDITTGTKYEVMLCATSPKLDQNNLFTSALPYFKGLQNVYIKMKDYKSAGIDKIAITKYKLDETLITQVHGGRFNEAVAGNPTMVPTAMYLVPGDAFNPMVNNTWTSTILKYENIVVSQDTNTFVSSICSSGVSAGQTMSVRIGSPTATPIATIITPDTGWSNYLVQDATLNQTLLAGTYDIYLTFAIPGKTCNLYWFGFRIVN